MPIQSEPSNLIWPTVEDLRADNQRIVDAKVAAQVFQNELMTQGWLSAINIELNAIRNTGQIRTNLQVFCPNGGQQPQSAADILPIVVATILSLIPGIQVSGDIDAGLAFVELDWALPL